jgi:hypothetical protein
MIALWLFAAFWCTISFLVFGTLLLASAPWSALAFSGVFALIGVSLIVGLILTAIQRWRLGPASLVADPASVEDGDRVTLRLQLKRNSLDTREVKFELALQEDDDGWTTRRCDKRTATLHAGTLNASTQFAIEPNVPHTTSTRRWHATATVHGMRFASVDCDVNVLRSERAKQPSNETFALDATAITESIAAAPDGAREIAPGVWTWTHTYAALRVIGVFLLCFACFWLWGSSKSVFVDLIALMRGRGSSLGSLGALLFHLPFLIVGTAIFIAAIGALTHRFTCEARHGQVSVRASVLGLRVHERTIAADDITHFQAGSWLTSGNAVWRYSLVARTERGAAVLPIEATGTEALAASARWLATVMGCPSKRFDPVMMDSSEPRLLLSSDSHKAISFMGMFKSVFNAAFMIGVAGFALLLLGVLWAR